MAYPYLVQVRVGYAFDGAAENAIDGPGVEQAVLLPVKPVQQPVRSRGGVCPVELLLLLLHRRMLAVHVVVLLLAPNLQWEAHRDRLRQVRFGVRHLLRLLELSFRLLHRLLVRRAVCVEDGELLLVVLLCVGVWVGGYGYGGGDGDGAGRGTRLLLLLL